MCKKKEKKRVMNHFSQAPPYIHISNHITLKILLLVPAVKPVMI